MAKKEKKTEKVDGRRARSLGGYGAGKTSLLAVRVDAARRERWQKAADRDGETISERIRRLMDEAS